MNQTINDTQKETIDGLKTDNKQLQDLISSLNDKMAQKDEILKVKLDYNIIFFHFYISNIIFLNFFYSLNWKRK